MLVHFISSDSKMKTDFAGRSINFNNDESMTEYQDLLGKLSKTMESLTQNASEASVVADVIYGAATDDTDRLRYKMRKLSSQTERH